MNGSRFKEGDNVGRFKVALVLGRREVRKGRSKMWVYRLQCACGRFEELPQERLVSGKSQRIDCTSCMRKRTAGRPQAIKTWISAKDLPYGVPNPALLPVPATIQSGPEKPARQRYV